MESGLNDIIEKLKARNAELDADMRKAASQLEEELSLRRKLEGILTKNKKDVEELDSTLSCLSCLEYLKEPLVLVCGHSICTKCFGQHGDTASKDSLVFCEECKIETKNKALQKQPVMKLICDSYGN